MTPHKCPVCEGSGYVYDKSGMCTSNILKCHACSGTGIVWEPESLIQQITKKEGE